MKKQFLSICTIIKNEGRYLLEWISHHEAQGAEHFYIFDNNDYHQAIDIQVPDNVTWIYFPGHAKQRAAYNHAIEYFVEETEWMAFIDVDEFLYSPKGKLPDVIQKYDASGIAVHWLLFGSNGEDVYRDAPVRERFTRRADEVNPHVKSIMKMSDVICMGNDPHTFRSRGVIVDENHTVMPTEYAVVVPATADILRINHYHTKSKEEARERWKTPRADTGTIRSFEENFAAHDRNDVEDRGILEVK